MLLYDGFITYIILSEFHINQFGNLLLAIWGYFIFE